MSPELAARNRRVSFIRRRIVATSVTTFAVAWAVIFFQLVIGDDPGLAHKAAKSAASTTQSSGNSSSSTSSDSGAGSTSQDHSTGSSSSPAPVTTAQS
jgi:hypothetical protein